MDARHFIRTYCKIKCGEHATPCLGCDIISIYCKAIQEETKEETKVDYIKREAALNMVCSYCAVEELCEDKTLCDTYKEFQSITSEDVVSKEVFNQVLWERDIALSQLAEIDKGLGENMDDVEKVKYGRWTLNKDGSAICSECGRRQLNAWDMDGWDNFCHHCGVDMRWGGVNV